MNKPLALLLVMVLAAALPFAALAQTADAAREVRAAYDKALALERQGKYAEALPYYQKALDLARATFGKDHVNTATIQNGLACLYKDLDQYAKAETLYQGCLEIYEARLGRDHTAVAQSLNDLAALYVALGQYTKAEPLYQRSLQIMEARLGRDHPDVSFVINNLAVVYFDMGQYAKAEPLYQRSLHIKETKLGKDHTDVAKALNNLAILYKYMGQYARAEALYQRSLDIREAKLGKDHPEVAASLNNLAALYSDLGQYAKAEALDKRSLDIREAKLGKDHVEVANSLNNLAALYVEINQYAKAEPLYQRSLQIWEAKLGKDHPLVAASLSNLGLLYKNTGQYAKAAPLYQHGLQILEARMGKDHPDVAKGLANLALLHAATQEWDTAARVMDRQRRTEARHVARVLPILAAPEQMKFLATVEDNLGNALSLALARREDPETLVRSAAWLLNTKGVAQQALTERALLERDATDPARRKLVNQLTAVRQQQAALALAMPKADQQAERVRQLQELSERQQRLEQQLVQAGGTAAPSPWVDLDQVRAAVPADAVFVDIARFKTANFKATGEEKYWGPARYAAWLVPAKGQGEVKLIDLGDADNIDAAVAAVRKGLLAAQGTPTQKSVIVTKGEAEAEKELRPALAALAKLVLQPLAEHIDKRAQWVISPDGALWLVPWAALPLDDKTYAVEKHTISYVVSGRDLVTPAVQVKGKRDESVIIADPDFDIDPKEATVVTAKLLGKPALMDGTMAALASPQGTRPASALGRVGRLPGTAVEALTIKPKLQAYAGEEPWVYRDKNALEGVFKAFRSPKVVVLSTHGFFLDKQEFKDQDRAGLDGDSPVLTRDGKLPENPLLRCGLLLAGCNQAALAKPGQEDGVLTGLEIVGCDLRGTELVVLSACETGLGQVRNGEGVAGLRQAFQLAGAQAVVASLWQVSDRDTAFLMSDFFDSLAKGKSKAEALRAAQLARIKAHRERDDAAHPFYWAAFTVTGK